MYIKCYDAILYTNHNKSHVSKVAYFYFHKNRGREHPQEKIRNIFKRWRQKESH